MRGHSPQARKVLLALAADTSRWRHGYDLSRELGLRSGSLYPILIRLADRGFLEARWDKAAERGPRRHEYRLTPAGVAETVVSTAAAARLREAPA